MGFDWCIKFNTYIFFLSYVWQQQKLFYFIVVDFFFFLLPFLSTDALRIVKDRKYGAKNADEVGGWDGMVGELVRRVCLVQYMNFCINWIDSWKKIRENHYFFWLKTIYLKCRCRFIMKKKSIFFSYQPNMRKKISWKLCDEWNLFDSCNVDKKFVSWKTH